jgi:hypothetical protein
MTDFGERHRDAIEAGEAALDQWLGAADLNSESAAAVAWHVAHLEAGAEAVLLAATREIPCPLTDNHPSDHDKAAYYARFGKIEDDDECEFCRGSAVLRVLPTTEEG